MLLSETGINLIKDFEGFHPEAYQCPAGIWTIGYGHTAGVHPGNVVSVAQAEILLRQDISESEYAIRRFVSVLLHQHQFDALVSFVFNIGSGNFSASTLLKKLNAGNYIGAANEFLRWIYASGMCMPGLVRRREAEKALFTGVDFQGSP